MGTKTFEPRSFLYAAAWASVIIAACVQQNPGGSGSATGDQTQVQVGQIVPGPGSSPGGIVAGSGNALSTSVPGMPSLQNIALTMSVAAASAPDLCLSLSDGNAAQPNLILRSCAADTLQKWVFVSGVLQSSKGQCLSIDPTQNNAAVMVACDVNNVNQQLFWGSGQLTSSAVANQQLVLQVPASPATTTSVVNFAPADIARITQQRWILAQQEHDSTQLLVTHGVPVAVLEKSGTCLSAAGDVGYAACSNSDANQKWILTDTGYFQNEATKKCLGMGASAASMIDCNPGPYVAWFLRGGLINDVNNTCLDVDGTNQVLKPCDAATSRHFIFGLSRGL